MLTYYNHRGVWITDQWVATGGRRYPIRELDSVRTARGPMNPLAVRILGVGGSMLAMAVLLGPVAPVVATAGLGIAGLLSAGSAVVLTRTNPRLKLVWIDVRGIEALLLATSDPIEVGKVLRALRRALERDARSLVS